MLLIAGIVLLAFSCSQRYDKIKLGEIHRIHSAALDESRLLYIYKPKGYDFRETSYPVLYVLDGEKQFRHTSGMVEFLAQNIQIPQMLVVGIQSINGDQDFGPPDEDRSPRDRLDIKFRHFISDEVTAYINAHYRNDPYQILAGHSLGGLCVLNIMLQQPAAFNAYIVLSPWLIHNDSQFITQSDSLLKAARFRNNTLFLSYAEDEYYLLEPIEQFTDQLRSIDPNGLSWTAVTLNYECHETTAHPGLYYGIKNLFSEWRYPHRLMQSDLARVKEHFRKVSQHLGYRVNPPEEILNIVGYNNLDNGNSEEAVAIFIHNTELYPNSANVYDSLGEAYERSGDLDAALTNYNLAYERAIRMDDPDIEYYKNHITRIRNKIRGRATAPDM